MKLLPQSSSISEARRRNYRRSRLWSVCTAAVLSRSCPLCANSGHRLLLDQSSARVRDDRPARGEEPKPKPKPTKIRRGSDRPVVQTHAVVYSGSNPTSGQYSQGPGTQRKTSPSTATWQTDGNDR